jgi:phosphatidate cytidylyltransferase
VNNLTQRVLTAIVGASLLIGAIVYSEASFLLILMLITVLSLVEFYRLAEGDGIRPQTSFGLLIAGIVFIPPLLNTFGIALNLLPLLIITPFIVFIRELYTGAEKPFTNIAYTLLGQIYLVAPLFLFYLFGFQGVDPTQYHWENILGFLFILWASDTGGYFAGRFLGKHKLFERVSPKKTWEGWIGGLVLAYAVAWIVSGYFTNFNRTDWMVIAGLIVVTGTLGDLVESLFKRSIQIKDSGSLLPGHGGFLDRFDGLFISVPFVFTYLLLR